MDKMELEKLEAVAAQGHEAAADALEELKDWLDDDDDEYEDDDE